MENAIWAFMGTIIGALTSIATTVLNSRNSIKIQTQVEQLRVDQKRKEYQRANLLTIQEKLHENLRLFARMYLEDLKNYRKGEFWSESRLGEELNESVRNSVSEISIYIERIDDEELRNAVRQYSRNFSSLILANTEDEAESAHMSLMNGFNSLMEKLGIVLRNT